MRRPGGSRTRPRPVDGMRAEARQVAAWRTEQEPGLEQTVFEQMVEAVVNAGGDTVTNECGGRCHNGRAHGG